MAEQNDLFSKYGGVSLADDSTTPTQTPAPSSGQSQKDTGDIFSKYGGQTLSPATSTSTFSEASPSQPFRESKPESMFSAYGGTSLSSESELRKPEMHTGLDSKADAPDPDAPWYKKIWETVNAPLFDEQTAKNWFGWDVEHWNGWGKGLFDLASGLTSPLSIALAVGTFGSGALLESGGMAALRGAGMAADEIGQVIKGSELLAKAVKMGTSEDIAFSAMPKLGIDPAVVKQGLGLLDKAGLKGEALLGSGIVRRTGGAMLRGAGMDVATADKVSHFAQLAMDAGFTLQNAYGAVIASPRVLDAIKEGDYESAKRLAVDAIGSGGFALLGAKAVHQHAGDLMTDAEAATGLRVKPSEENAKIQRLLEPREGERVVAGEREKQWEQAARKEFKEVVPYSIIGEAKKDSKWIAGGANESDLRARFFRESEGNLQSWHDAIREAAGRREIKETPVEDMKEAAEREWLSKQSDTAQRYWTGQMRQNPDVLSEMFPKEIESLIKSFANKQPPHLPFPEEIQNAIDSFKLKDKPKEYVDQLLKATDPALLTDQEKAYAKHVGAHFDETGERAVGEEALSAMAEAYVTRVFKNAQDSDSVRKFRSVAGSSNFGVDTAMARKRIFQTTLEGILKGHELEDHDMMALAAHNGNEFSRIVSDRKTLSRFRGAGARQSDGRPTTALSGSGHIVESMDENGDPVDPALLINPKAMQSVRMSNKQVAGLKANVLKPGSRISPLKGKGISVSEGKETEGVLGSTLGAKTHDLTIDGKNAGQINVAMSGDSLNIIWMGEPLQEGKSVSELRGLENKLGISNVKAIAEELAHRYGAKEISFSREGGAAGRNIAKGGDVLLTSSYPVPEPKMTPEFTDLNRMIKEGRVVKFGVDKKTGEDLYGWTTHDYRTITTADGKAHPAFTDWKFTTTDTDGNPVFVKSEMKVHPEAYEYLQRTFGSDGGLKLPGKGPLLAAAREAKGLLLAFSPFHYAQEGLRAVMTWISPIGVERFNPANPMHVLAAEKGVLEFKDYKGVKAFEDGLLGHSKLISKVPGLREIQSWTQTMLFDKYIPGLKLRAFERMYETNKRMHPTWTKEKWANESADEVNERFGGIPYKRIGRSAAAMDLARLTTLAPDWLESEMRFMKRVFTPGDEGTVARRDIAKMTLGLWVTARVLNYALTGKAHNEAPFGVVHKDEDGREKVYSMRTMPGDMLHAIQDPVNFLNGRVSPLLRTGVQTATGRDEYGRKMSTNGIFVNLLRNVSPIGLQSVAKQVTGQDTQGISSVDSGMKAAGFTVYPYRTEAQKLAAKIASDHTEAGPVDQDKLRRHQGIIDIEDRIRTGRMPITDVYKSVENGTLHVEEAKKIIKNLQDTQGMDHEMARLYAHAARLPMADLIKVWNESTNEEKASLSKLLLKKKTSYLKKAFKEMSPAERQTDSVYQWIKRSFPSDPLGMGEITAGKPGTSPQEFIPSQGQNQVFKEQRALPGMKVGGSEKIENAPTIKGVKVDTLEKAYDVFNGRPLSKDELQKVAPIFQNLLDLGVIRVHEIPPKILEKLEGATTVGAVSFDRPDELGLAKGVDFKQRATTKSAVVGHEVTHIYQAHGGKYREGKELIGGKYGVYDYGTLEDLTAARGKGLKFSDLTVEQQGEVVGNYIDTVSSLDELKASRSSGRKTYLTDVYTYQLKALQPYVDDLIHSRPYKDSETNLPKRKLEEAVDSVTDLIKDVRKGDFSKLGIF